MKHQETVTTHEYTYTAVFALAPEGGYAVTVPALPWVVTEGDTLEEARARVIDAIQGYLEQLQAEGRLLPLDERCIAEVVEPVRVQLTAV